MVVPQTRMLIWATLVLLPFGTLAGMDTAARPFAWVVLIVFAGVAIVDLLLARRRVKPFAIDVAALTRVSRDRDAQLTVRVHNPGRQSSRLRLALQLPPPLGATVDELRVTVPAGAEWSQASWPIHPTGRGKFMIQSARIEAMSPLGLWGSWRSTAVSAEVRVYPNLLKDRKSLAALFLNRGAMGLHAQRMVGKGREFEKLRDYVPGDSYDEIHWKATAKRGQPVTKVFQLERTQEVYVIVDASRLSARAVPGTGISTGPADESANNAMPPGDTPSTESGRLSGESTLERFITAALVLGLAAEKQGDLFGLLTFSDKIETFVRARNGKAHYHACRDALYTLQAKEVAPDFDELSTFIRLRLRRRALLLFLTSLDDPVLAESFVRSMDLLCRQHLVVVNMLRPAGALPLFSDPAESDNSLYHGLAGHMRWHNLRELEKILQRRGVRFSVLAGDQLASDMVSQYLNIKQRQVL